jgi:YVTN family beta-propeller protein
MPILKIEGKNTHSNFVFGQDTRKNFVSGYSTGSYPIGITINPFTNKIYVANQFSNTISVFDSKTDELKQTIPTDTFPYSIDTNLFNNRIYVANRGSDNVLVIDGSTDTIIDRIGVGKSPVQVAVDPSNNWIYVSNIDSNSISVIDGITNKVIKTINGINNPYGIGVNPISKKIYITELSNSSSVTVLDNTNYNILKNIKVGKAPVAIDIDIEKNIILVSNYLSNSLSIINGTDDSLIKTIPVGNFPVGVKVNPVSEKAYVSNIGSNTVSVINESNLEKSKDVVVNPSLITEREEYPFQIPISIKFPLIASFIGIDTLTNLVYVTNTASNTISSIDGNEDENIVRVKLDVQPSNAGFIECTGIKNTTQNTLITPVNTITSCKAIPERGYTFNFWSGLVSSGENPLKTSFNEYGDILANFKPTLSYEQYIFIIGGIIGIFSVLFSWIYKGRQRRKFSKFNQIINQTIENANFGDKAETTVKLEHLRNTIFNSYRKGSLTDFEFDFLDKKLLNYIDKISKI